MKLMADEAERAVKEAANDSYPGCAVLVRGRMRYFRNCSCGKHWIPCACPQRTFVTRFNPTQEGRTRGGAHSLEVASAAHHSRGNAHPTSRTSYPLPNPLSRGLKYCSDARCPILRHRESVSIDPPSQEVSGHVNPPRSPRSYARFAQPSASSPRISPASARF